MVEPLVLAAAYLLIGLAFAVGITLQVMDSDGNVYDDSALPIAVAMLVVWPFGILAWVAPKVVVGISRSVHAVMNLRD